MDLIKSGISGLDELMKGGIRKNSSILISGVPGSGKTIFSLQFIYAGAQNNEPGLFISCEEKQSSIIQYAKEFGFDFEKYKDKINIIYQPIMSRVMTFGNIIDIIKQKKIKRVALDSLTFFSYANTNEINFRKEVLSFLEEMRDNDITIIATAEKEICNIDNIFYKSEDFLFGGLFILFKIRKGSTFERCITIQKMRNQDHRMEIFPFTIGKKGIEIYPNQIPFSLIEKGE